MLGPIQPLKMDKNLHFDNDKIFMSFNNYKETGYGLDLDFLIISFYLHV